MGFLRHFFAATLVLLFGLTAASAQDDDKSFLTRKIQDALSGGGRTVDIVGFSGALSSAASFDRMTIADKDGIWLTLEDVVLDWNRSALLRGRLEVQSLTAARLDLPRLPIVESTALPDAEAKPFALPELPVSIEVADFSVAEINLGAPLLGEEAQLSVKANARLTDQVGIVDFTAERTDGKQGVFAIKADFNRNDSVLDLLLNLTEEKEGIAARLLNLPGQPSVEMSVKGNGPLDDFRTDVTIATDGQERLAGEITLGAQGGVGGAPDRRIQADIGGDITALLAPRYREFFGENVRLTTDALIESRGSIDVSSFTLEAQAASLKGTVKLNSDKWPTLIDISGSIASPDGTPILLPVSGENGTTVERVDLRIDYNANDGEVFDADFDITALNTSGLAIARTKLAMDGTLQGNLGSVGQFLGDLKFSATGLELTNAASAEAIGSEITGKANINYIEGSPVRISDLDLTGADYGLTGKAVINGFETGFLSRIDMALKASDLSRFSALAGRDLAGQAALALKGSATPLSGAFDLVAAGTTQDIKLGIEQADAVLTGLTQLSMAAERNENGTFLREVSLENDALSFAGGAELRTDDSQVEATATLKDVSLVLPQYEGPITVTGKALQDIRGWSVDVVTDGPYGAAIGVKGLVTGPNAAISFNAEVPQVESFAPDTPLTGPLAAKGTLRQTPDGWLLDTDASGPFDATASVDGLITPMLDINFDVSLPEVNALVPQVNGPLKATGTLKQTDAGLVIDTQASGPYAAQAAIKGALTPMLDINFDVSLPEVNALVPQVNGPLKATGTLKQTDAGFVVDTQASGPYATQAAIKGALTPMLNISFDVALPDVNPLVPQVNGPLKATGTLRQTELGLFIDTNATGPYGARAMVEGLATGPEMSLTFDVAVPDVNPLVPSVSGPFAAKGVLRQTEAGIFVDTNASGPYAARASVQGVVTGDNADIDFNLTVPNIGALVDNISGPLTVTGNAKREAGGFRIDTNAVGPAGTNAAIAGLVNQDGTLNLDINGSAPLGLSGPFIAPRDLQGQAAFDLKLNGPAALSSLSGTIRTTNATLSAPTLRVALRNIAANITLGNNRANLDVSAEAVSGGRVRIGGGVTLTPALPADIEIALQDLVLIDPKLYRTSLSGALRLSGPLSGGAQIAGQINVGETEVNVPSTGLTSIGDIPQITHLGEGGKVVATRAKADLEDDAAGVDPTDAPSGPGFGLNIRINAPNRIFVRGRGLDAELGGAMTITGSTNRIISAGRFELVRGRLDILGKRFDLVEGSIQFQGDLIPYLRFVTATDTDTGEVRVIVQGPANEPEVSFESTPESPQDEVLAQLLFGRNIADISAFQALQLASAVATLAGRGGGGIISNLREGFGLDDFDVTTTDDGATALRVGKYLSENVYTDVTAASDGTAEISLNLDITTNLKGKATLGSEGDSSIGIFFEKDY
ncbi:autotransporter secretion inner membrane protein TamB [Sulfitobacter brevis]|uniref:Autotransporter secretion inner membrane protein TamB n=1 Tax=Sulfitobacter brevis TaxID=74348 RepID=A0A1I2AAU9_9RHOB|nr:translocation/assembly module TamB domain-containing protein [Sulfitobacter brevis]SFE40093.1 autotransporter secretion inner membrane protein TamB [Sulfitobacter brevis]